jgi:hypothetical protein
MTTGNEILITLGKWEWGWWYDEVFAKFVVGSFGQVRRKPLGQIKSILYVLGAS